MNENISSAINSTPLTENDLLGLVHAVGLQVAKSVSIKSQSDLGNWRQFIEIGFCGGEHNAEYGQMVIDYRDGSPHLDQVYNLVYGPSSNCRHKVILFTGEKRPDELDDPGANSKIVRAYIEFFNEMGAHLNLVEVTTGVKQAPAYNILLEANISVAKSLPREMAVKNFEFWDLYFYPHFNKGWTDSCQDLKDSSYMMMDHIGYISNDDFEIVSYCDEDGIGYYVKQKLYPFEYIEEIWERKGARLRSIFPDYKINCHIGWLEIMVNDKPIDWGLYATSEKKRELGRKLWAESNKILRFIDNELAYIKLEKYTTPHGLLRI